MKLCCTAVMLVLLVGCGTTSRVVRLNTGQTDTLVFTPRSGAEPVALGNGELKEAVSALAREVRPPTRPQEAARRLFEVEARSGSYTYETPSRRLTPLEPGEHLEGQSTTAEEELTRAYLRWCERTGRPGDCLRLLTEGPTVNGDGRFALAMALAKGAVLDEMLEAFKDMADPHAMVAAVLWTWTTLHGPPLHFAAVGEVETVAVSAETVTIALAPGAVAMTARGTSGDGNSPKGIIIPGCKYVMERSSTVV